VRVASVIAAFALVFAAFALVEQRAEASPSVGAAVAAIAAPPAAAITAQVLPDFASIFCPILIAVRNSFVNSPFFAFVVAAINPFLAAFGCAPS